MFLDFWILFFLYHFNHAFNPDVYDYDAYGLKIAMNEVLFVQVQNTNNPPTFLIQFSPDNDTTASNQCFIFSPNMTDHYVYTVIISPNESEFFFAGELINGRNGTFIGAAKYNSSASSCDQSFTFSVQYFDRYEHQEYYVIAVESTGRFVYGFANRFVYIFDSQINSIVNLWDGNFTWPDHSIMPHAVDFSGTFGIIAGFIRNPIDSIAIYIPIIYLINFNASNNYPIIVHAYQPNATLNTWQDLLTNSNADVYSAKYDMSIDINPNGNILVGMQFINRVFLFSVNLTNPNRLNFISRNTNGRSLGNGKGVAWLENEIAAVLVNSYSLMYQWSSSTIYFYDIENDGYTSDSIPLSVFPNYHQSLPLSFSTTFLNIVSSPSSLAFLNERSQAKEESAVSSNG